MKKLTPINRQNKETMADQLYEPPPRVRDIAYIKSKSEYEKMYKNSIEDPQTFWKNIADQFYWKEPLNGKVFDYNINVEKGPVFIKCMDGAKTNIAYNCLDRNIEKGLGDNIAYFW